MAQSRLGRYGEPPCDHYDEMIGTISAGDLKAGPHCSVATCAACTVRSAGYVQIVTGHPASPLLTYQEARKVRHD